MMTFKRINHKTGLEYTFTALPGNQTTISVGDKSITVNHNIHNLNQSYYDWQQRNQKIQDAFPYLSPDEREFILTGTTNEEWNEMFPPEHEE